MKYSQQHAIITGGSSGIGKAVARLLIREGANLTLVARDRDKLERVRQELEGDLSDLERQINTIAADVSQLDSITAAIEGAIAALGPPDILITAAGIAHPGYFSDMALEIFQQTMAIDYFGSLYSVKAVVPSMIERQRGQIVLISSGAGLIGIYGYSAYCPAKFAVRGLAESLRGELKPHGIGVTIVYPPDTDTPQLAAENKIKPEATKQMTATAKTWSATAVAEQILLALERGQFAIAPGLELTIIKRWHSLLAPIINWYFDRIVAKINNKKINR